MQWVQYSMKLGYISIFRNDAKANVIQTYNKTDESYKITKYQNKNMTFSPLALWSLVYSQKCKYTHEGICNACVKLTHMGRRRVRSQNVLKKDSFQIIQNVPAYAVFNIVFLDALRPRKHFSVISGLFLDRICTKCRTQDLAQGRNTTQWSRWVSNQWPLELNSSTLLLSLALFIGTVKTCKDWSG